MEIKTFNLDNFNPFINYVLEASAGTGKTYNIVEIVKKLVNEQHIDINKILIVTFTEKAAGELKDRIRNELKCDNVDSAPIYTIHSFCQNAIKEFGLSANLPFNLNVVDENEMTSFTERYIRESAVLKDLTDMYIMGEEISLDKIIKTFVQGCSKYYLNKDYQEDESIISLEYSENLIEIHHIKIDCFNELSFSELLNKYSNMAKYYDILLSTGDDKCLDFVSEIESTYKDNFKYNGSKFKITSFKKIAKETNNPSIVEAFEYFKDLKDRFKDYKAYKVLGTLYLKDFYIKYQQEKELNKNQTFDDMIRYVRESIMSGSSLKTKLQEKYQYAIIDEFQDTNQRQFDIFKNIFMEDEQHRIIVVGDPKQSIYSFQGADIDVYYQAVKEILETGGEICRLNTNYRSTESIVKSCNKLFNYYDFTGTTFEDCGYLSKTSNSYHDTLYLGKPTHGFWICKGEDDKSIQPEEFPKIVVEQIIDCCTKDQNGNTKLQVKSNKENNYRNVSFKDFAVLARTKAEMVDMEKALKKAGIPYIRYKDQQLFKGKECAHWITLLSSIVSTDFTGHNRKILKKALFTQFFGLTLEQINSDYTTRDDIEEVVLINKWQHLYQTNNWKELFDDIITSSKLTQKMNTLKDIQSFSIYKQIGSFCVEYLSRGKSINELIRTLTNLSTGGEYDGDDLNGTIIEKSTNFDCVQIMTIHASKGLQFPVVIGAAGFKGRNRSSEVYQTHKKINNQTKKILSFEKSEEVDKESIAELKRLFYVAYTRPQFILMLPLYKNYCDSFLNDSLQQFMKDFKDQYRTIYSNNSSYQKLRQESSKILKSSNENIVLSTSTDQEENLKKLIKTSITKKIDKHSYSSLSHNNIEQEIDEENKEGNIEIGLSMFDKHSKMINGNYDETLLPIDLPNDYPKGPKLGTALHEIFEGLDFVNSSVNLTNKIKRCFRKQGIELKEEWITSTINIVSIVLESKLPIVYGSKVVNEFITLKDITIDNKLDEVEFNFNLIMTKLKNYCNGFVDMIFKHGDYYSIVDWKSDRLNEEFTSYSNHTILKSHVDECYSIQRVLYSYCLINWLKQSMPNKTHEQIFNEHFGGVYYIFLRGCNVNTSNGIYVQTWDSWNDLKQAFEEIVKYKVGGVKHD